MNYRNECVPHNTEDRHWWYAYGEQEEARFVDVCLNHLKLDAKINPDKFVNKYAPDLVVNGILSDLKSQTTPFFTANKYKLDPRFTVTFNRKDYERYNSLYPNIDIYFWINWTQTESKWGSVNYFAGIYTLPFSDLKKLIERPAPEHYYVNRQNPNDLNAKSSFLLDVRQFNCLFYTE
jgi:hypothetical protein